MQAILPMAYLLIFLTSAYQQPEQIESPVMRAIIDANPAEHVLRPMRELMLSGYDWPQHRPRGRGHRRARRDRHPAHGPQLPLGLPLIAAVTAAGPFARLGRLVMPPRRSSSISQQLTSMSRSWTRARCTRDFMPEVEMPS